MEHRKILNLSNDANGLKIVHQLLNVLQKLMEQQKMMRRI